MNNNGYNEVEETSKARSAADKADSLVRCMKYSMYEDSWTNQRADFDNLLGILSDSVGEVKEYFDNREVNGE